MSRVLWGLRLLIEEHGMPHGKGGATRVLVLETKSLLDWHVVDGTHKEKGQDFFLFVHSISLRF